MYSEIFSIDKIEFIKNNQSQTEKNMIDKLD